MRELTFQGFLASYVKSLSLNDTLNIRVLAAEAAEKNPRLREPLVLYALLYQKEHLLRRAMELQGVAWDGDGLLQHYDGNTVLEALQKEDLLPQEYVKVWKSYVARHDRFSTEEETKRLIGEKIAALRKERRISNYRIYTDLRLNPGNVNAWLKHGHSDKVSLETARNILRYVKNYQKN